MAKYPTITKIIDFVSCSLQIRPVNRKELQEEIARVSKKVFQMYDNVINPNVNINTFRITYNSTVQNVPGNSNALTWMTVGGVYNIASGSIDIFPDHIDIFCKHRFGMKPIEYAQCIAVMVTLHEMSHAEQCFYTDYKLNGSKATTIMETRNDQRTIKFINEHWDELKREFPHLQKWYFNDRMWANVTDNGKQDYIAMPLKYKGLKKVLFVMVTTLQNNDDRLKTSEAFAAANNVYYSFDGNSTYFIRGGKPIMSENAIDCHITELCKKTNRDYNLKSKLVIDGDTVGFVFK